MKQDALEPLLDDLRRRLRALYGERLEAVWLYGSRARETARAREKRPATKATSMCSCS